MSSRPVDRMGNAIHEGDRVKVTQFGSLSEGGVYAGLFAIVISTEYESSVPGWGIVVRMCYKNRSAEVMSRPGIQNYDAVVSSHLVEVSAADLVARRVR